MPTWMSYSTGHFQGIAWERLSHCKKAAGTNIAFSLVERIMDGIATIFRPKCTILQDFAYTISHFFWGLYSRIPEKRLCFRPRHQFPLGSSAFPLFRFYETTTELCYSHMSRYHISNCCRVCFYVVIFWLHTLRNWCFASIKQAKSK